VTPRRITPRELAARIAAAEPLVLLDVREPEELGICALERCVHIPMALVPARHAELARDATIVCICHHGVRSARVAGLLASLGFDSVLNLEGGIDRWAEDVDPRMPRY
jgi:rhodanese-related sulfurtransferase